MCHTGFVQVLEKSGKSWNLKLKFSRSGKLCKMTLGIEKSWKMWLLTWKIKMFITLVIIPALRVCSLLRPFCDRDRFVNFDQVQSGYPDAWDHGWERHVHQVVECCQNVACSFTQSSTHTHTHTHRFNGHFLGEPGIAGCPLNSPSPPTAGLRIPPGQTQTPHVIPNTMPPGPPRGVQLPQPPTLYKQL